MALNWVMLDANRHPLSLPGESNISIPISDVECTLDTPSMSVQSTSSDVGRTRQKESGGVMLSDKRVSPNDRTLWCATDTVCLIVPQLIFVARSDLRANPSFESLTIPLESILSCKFEQPFFGSNYVALGIKPSEGGRLPDGTTVEIRSHHSGLHSFVCILEKTRERAVYMRHSLDDEELRMHSRPLSSLHRESLSSSDSRIFIVRCTGLVTKRNRE